MEWFLSDVCTPDWNIEQDRGRDWDEAVALLRNAIFPTHEAADPRLPRALARDGVRRHRRERRHLLERLRDAGVPNYCITNFSAQKFVARAGRVSRFSPGSTASSSRATHRVLKPDPEIYHLLLDALRPEGRRLRLHRRFERTWKARAPSACTRSTSPSRCDLAAELRARPGDLSRPDAHRLALAASRMGRSRLACAPSTTPLPIDEVLPDLTASLARAPNAGAGRAARAPARPRGCRSRCSTSPGSRAASSSCWSRAGSPPARPRTGWRARSAKRSARRSACACASARRSAARPASRWSPRASSPA